MKWFLVIVLLLALLGGGGYYLYTYMHEQPSAPPAFVAGNESARTTPHAPRVEVIAENLNIPWEILFLPDGELLVTERTGNLRLLKQGVTIPVPGVTHVGEGGLLGAALHPDFQLNNWIYLYQTTETETGLVNRVVRYVLKDQRIDHDRVIIDDLPGARYHDGGRIAFGPDGYLYVTVGDAGDERAAQDKNALAGSILRLTDGGEIPADNPYGTAVYSYGHRNPQGLAWDRGGNLWSSEHGRSGVLSGYDELNLILRGVNYGWPDHQGDKTTEGKVKPKYHSGSSTTWAPGGLAYLEGRLFMPGLRGETLYEAVIDGVEIVAFREHLVEEYGRLRTVQVGPDKLLYITTSNRDGRGFPQKTDDRILRVNPALLE